MIYPSIRVVEVRLPPEPERPPQIVSLPRFDPVRANAIWLNVRGLFTPGGVFVCEGRKW